MAWKSFGNSSLQGQEWWDEDEDDEEEEEEEELEMLERIESRQQKADSETKSVYTTVSTGISYLRGQVRQLERNQQRQLLSQPPQTKKRQIADASGDSGINGFCFRISLLLAALNPLQHLLHPIHEETIDFHSG
jgi:hypothetical protein